MPESGESLRPVTSCRHASFGDGAAVERIDAACRQAFAGKLALRDLAAWVRGFGVTEGDFRLLWELFERREGGGEGSLAFDQAELAERLAVSPAQISSVVERLQVRQWIERVRDGADRRRQLWRLSHAGGELVQAVVASVEQRSCCAQIPPPVASQEATALRSGDFGSPVLGCSHPFEGGGYGVAAIS
jgi:DNA-binding MarR family transcriptional regulator